MSLSSWTKWGNLRCVNVLYKLTCEINHHSWLLLKFFLPYSSPTASNQTCSCLKARQTKASIKSILTPFPLLRCVALLCCLPPTYMHRHPATLPEKPDRAHWQMCHGNSSPYHLFFGALLPNTQLSVLQPRTE